MSVTSTEVNYLIWRYLQETGLEISAFALQDETKINEYDVKYKDKIPIGCLVNLLQKGILYSLDDDLVADNGDILREEEVVNRFTLFGALSYDKVNNPTIEPIDRFRLQTDHGDKKDIDHDVKMTEMVQDSESREFTGVADAQHDEEAFTSVIERSLSFSSSVSCSWNPENPLLLAYGQRDSTAKIVTLSRTQKPGSDEEIDSIKETITLTHPHPLNSLNQDSTIDIATVSWSPKGNSLLTASETGELRLWSEDGKLKNVGFFHNTPIWCVKWSNDGNYILTVDSENNSIIWDHDCKLIQQISSASTHTNDTGRSTENYGIDACWIDNNKCAIPGKKHTILVYQVGEKSPVGFLEGHNNTIGCLVYNSDRHLLASGSDDNTIRIWKGNSANCTKLLAGHTQPIVSLHWLENDADSKSVYLLSTSIDGSIRVWDMKSGEMALVSILDGLPIIAADISPDKKWLVTGNSEGVVVIWDISIQTITKSIKENRKLNTCGSIRSVGEFQPDYNHNENSSSDDTASSISNISWDKDSGKICISYVGMESNIISWS